MHMPLTPFPSAVRGLSRSGWHLCRAGAVGARGDLKRGAPKFRVTTQRVPAVGSPTQRKGTSDEDSPRPGCEGSTTGKAK